MQIELNYLDWNYADEINDRNTDAVYLYAELEKRGIPAVIMEPLLGGRLAKMPRKVMRQLKPLNEKELRYLDKEIAEQIVDFKLIPCNDCKYCMPCPYGIDIPGVFLHYNRCQNESQVPLSKQDPDYAKSRRAFLIGYDRSVPRMRQADHCVGCGKCVAECPQRIRIPQEMQRISEYTEKLKQGTL